MNEKKLTFLDHLEDLRGRIIKSLIMVLIGMIFSFFFIPVLLPHIIKPVGKLVFISPTEAFTTRIMLAFYGGVFLSSPFLLLQMWIFILSGLRESEKKLLVVFVLISFFLFLFGCSFAYFVILPVGLKFLIGFGTELIVPMITVSRYVSFAGTIVLVFGVIFQMPLIILFLTKIGLVTPYYLSAKRREAILIVFIMAALLTPPDVITQVLMAIPMIFLYETSIIFSKIAQNKRK